MKAMTLDHDAVQERVGRVLAAAVRADPDEAVQVAAWIGGRLAVDAWAAGAQVDRTVDGDTLFPVFSTSKGIAATAIHRLVERGTLAWDAPIARWWPAFAAHGKAGITLRHALAHTAGLQDMPAHGTMAEVCDWERMCAALADATPRSPAGQRRDYHAMTYGWLIGEAARRADGRDFIRILDEEVSHPLGVDGLFIGLPDTATARVLDVLPDRIAPASPDAAAINPAVPPWVQPLETLINRADVRRACIPASNGIMSARAIAAHYAALLGPGLLGAATLAEATRAVVPGCGDDNGSRYGLGYALYGPPEDPSAAFGHGGYGGSMGLADRRSGLALGLVRRRMSSDGLVAAVREALAR